MNRLNMNITGLISRPSFASSSSCSSTRTNLPVLLQRSYYHSASAPPLAPLRTSFHPTRPIRPLPKWIGTGTRSASTTTSNPGPGVGLGLPPSFPPRSRIKVTPPDLDAVKREGYLDEDVQLVPEDQAWLNLTPDAISQLEKITSREPADVLAKGKLALRVGVESGGCHGYQYTMALTEERGVDDYIMQPEGVNCIPVVVDLISLGLLKGATLHHATELIGSSFRLQDNPQAKEGGACGCGVSWEAKT